MKIHSGVLLSHKKNEILSSAEKWMDLEVTVLHEISETQKDKYCMYPSYHVQFKNDEVERRLLLDKRKEMGVGTRAGRGRVNDQYTLSLSPPKM